jgi:UDP-N-acetylglucosamine--N-acetylmuramyl-(pentapeptide) pyrophosphoryl-undecaprenol N-acetylglucosamine transferase
MAARVMIMAGGTGGHVFPALAVAQELRARGCEISWLGTPDSFESRLIPGYAIEIDTIESFRLRGQGVFSLLLAPLRLLRAMLQAARVLRRRRPQVVLGMGGFASGPGGLVSRLLGMPLVIHEQNTIPGLTNRWLAKIASRVLQAFPGSFPASVGARVCGNPVRPEILALAEPGERFAGRAGMPVSLLVMGGSLGAQALNERIPEALGLMDGALRPQVLHQAGRGKLAATEARYREAGVQAQVVEFIEDMPGVLAQADLVVCRAGALTISELAAAGVASILVPFPFAVDDHQTRNAAYLSDAGAAILVQERDLDAAGLAGILGSLCPDRERLLSMAKAARVRSMPDALRCVADACLEVAA